MHDVKPLSSPFLSTSALSGNFTTIHLQNAPCKTETPHPFNNSCPFSCSCPCPQILGMTVLLLSLNLATLGRHRNGMMWSFCGWLGSLSCLLIILELVDLMYIEKEKVLDKCHLY